MGRNDLKSHVEETNSLGSKKKGLPATQSKFTFKLNTMLAVAPVSLEPTPAEMFNPESLLHKEDQSILSPLYSGIHPKPLDLISNKSVGKSLSFSANNALPHFGKQQQLSETVDVILTFQSEVMLIKNVKAEYTLDEKGRQQILLNPILNHIKALGKSIENLSISYFSEKDQMDVWLGIYATLGHYYIPAEDFKEKIKLKMTIVE